MPTIAVSQSTYDYLASQAGPGESMDRTFRRLTGLGGKAGERAARMTWPAMPTLEVGQGFEVPWPEVPGGGIDRELVRRENRSIRMKARAIEISVTIKVEGAVRVVRRVE